MASGKPKRPPASGFPAIAGARSVGATHLSSNPRRHPLDWRLLAAAIAASAVVVGTGTAMIFFDNHQDGFAITTTRPAEVIRFEAQKSRSDSIIRHIGDAQPKQDLVAVPPPTGTINRMNAIRGAFSK